jgi:hypothetical protein
MVAARAAIHQEDDRDARAVAAWRASLSSDLPAMPSNFNLQATISPPLSIAGLSAPGLLAPSLSVPGGVGAGSAVPRECVPDTPFGTFMSQTTHCPH